MGGGEGEEEKKKKKEKKKCQRAAAVASTWESMPESFSIDFIILNYLPSKMMH